MAMIARWSTTAASSTATTPPAAKKVNDENCRQNKNQNVQKSLLIDGALNLPRAQIGHAGCQTIGLSRAA